jgi:hypothetical protein
MAAPAPFGVEPPPSPWASVPAAMPLPLVPPHPRRRRRLPIGILAGLVMLAGGGLLGVNAYAEQRICAIFQISRLS